MTSRIVALRDADKGSIRSISRAAQVLALFDQDTTALTPAIVSDRLGLNRTTAHRYLVSLQAAGFLNHANGPGALLDSLSALTDPRRRVLGDAADIMRDLCDRTGMTVTLTMAGWAGAVVRLVEEAERGTIILTVRVGTVLEPRTSQSRVLLAFANDREMVARFHSTLDADERRDEQHQLDAIRRTGIGWAEVSHLGLSGVAAPVFDGGEVSAAMALIATDDDLSPASPSAEPVRLLRQAADALSVSLAEPERTG